MNKHMSTTIGHYSYGTATTRALHLQGILMHELMLGRTPFAPPSTPEQDDAEAATAAAKDRERRTLMAIVQEPLEFSATCRLSPAARAVIARFLEKEPALRMGTRRGTAEIKRHAFFAPVHWALLADAAPPFVPPPQPSDAASGEARIRLRFARLCGCRVVRSQ